MLVKMPAAHIHVIVKAVWKEDMRDVPSFARRLDSENVAIPFIPAAMARIRGVYKSHSPILNTARCRKTPVANAVGYIIEFAMIARMYWVLGVSAD